ncbi:MAG: CPBP family intramembrane metalloprotease [Clostridiales bacterium]|jgi:membrane protease YdiL (CAAX protease family)|nr:CPBP family intramembrane metalloprotease [Clostridiales bacterium]
MLQMALSELISSVLQVALYAVVPFVVWLALYRKKEGFFSWIGLNKIEAIDRERFVETVLGVTVMAFALRLFAKLVFSIVDDTQSHFQGLGAMSILPAMIRSIFNTGLSEELLFRGFIGKRLCAKFGFKVGNILQAGIYGLARGAALLTPNIPLMLATAALTGLIGWMVGFMNEKANESGSILPSWYIHSFSSFFSAMLASFNVF